MILVTTAKLAGFFREIGQPIKHGETPAAPRSGQVPKAMKETKCTLRRSMQAGAIWTSIPIWPVQLI